MNMIKIPIIYYHSVAKQVNKNWLNNFLTVKLVYFEDLIKYLIYKKYRFVFLDEYFDMRMKNSGRDKKLVCLTFDDGYLDNYVFVYPVLKKHKLKATIFVSPEYVQDNDVVRPTLENVWGNEMAVCDLPSVGYVSWSELRLMQKSENVDIQSHTLTHTKYYVSDKIREFHHPRSNYLYPISNIFPSKKPYCMTDPEFARLIPWGTPFFEEKSAIIARRMTINEKFEKECVEILRKSDWSSYSFNENHSKINALYQSYRSAKKLIIHTENNSEIAVRVHRELRDSKLILEAKLGKSITHCCWPHGDYNDYAHQAAIEEGYHSTNIVVKPGQEITASDRFNRIGSGVVLNSRLLTLWKNIYKINAFQGIFPYRFMQTCYNRVKHGIR
jgi:hypothetical protein